MSKITTSLTLPLGALALACAAAFTHVSAFAADDDDVIDPDRPDVVESSKTVGKGRLQLETSVQWDRLRDDTSHERTLSTPTLLRIGLGDAAELRFETDGRTVTHATDPATGEHATLAGYADTAVGVKWHLTDGQGSRPSLGLLVDATLPSGSPDLRGKGVRPFISLPAEWDLGHGWELTAMPGIGIESNDDDARYGYALFAVTIEKEITRRLHGFAELAAPQIARARNGGTQVQFDTGVTWLVNKDCQLDASIVHGLNYRTPDLGLAFGISIRR
jgi:hypothetical protein